MLGSDEKPDVTYADVGGLDMQKQEIREAVELPLTQFDLYKQIGWAQTFHWFVKRLTILRYRSAAGSATLRSSRHRQDHVGQGCCKQYYRKLHQSRGIRVCAEILG